MLPANAIMLALLYSPDCFYLRILLHAMLLTVLFLPRLDAIQTYLSKYILQTRMVELACFGTIFAELVLGKGRKARHGRRMEVL